MDTSALPDLTEAEEAEFKRLVEQAKEAIKPEADKKRGRWIDEKIPELVAAGTTEPEARRQLERIATGSTHDLPPGFLLCFATMGTVTVADVLADPKKYDGQALADPIEGIEQVTRG